MQSRAFSIQHSAFSIQQSAISIQHSTKPYHRKERKGRKGKRKLRSFVSREARVMCEGQSAASITYHPDNLEFS
jgi:hypothetical protein